MVQLSNRLRILAKLRADSVTRNAWKHIKQKHTYNFDFHGKVALVTGASSGIGLACVEALAKEGVCGIMLTDIDKHRGEAAVKRVNDYNSRELCAFAQLDVTDCKRFDDIFKQTICKFGHIDILVNNAGILDETKWERMVDVNLKGTVIGMLLGIEKYMIRHRTSNESIIVNVSSILGLDPMPPLPLYTATKHGVMGLSRSYGTQSHYEKTRIRVLVMCPGVTITPLSEGVEKHVRANFIKDMVKKDYRRLPEQAVEACGRCLIKMIDKGGCGSVWVTEDNECYEVLTRPRQCHRIPR